MQQIQTMSTVQDLAATKIQVLQRGARDRQRVEAEKAQRNLPGQKRDDVTVVAQEEAIAACDCLELPLPPAKLLLPVASAVPTGRASGNPVRYQESCSRQKASVSGCYKLCAEIAMKIKMSAHVEGEKQAGTFRQVHCNHVGNCPAWLHCDRVLAWRTGLQDAVSRRRNRGGGWCGRALAPESTDRL